jgi:LmbE family N-acetylglucosaminyl deacetylase
MNTILVIAPHPDDETLGCGGSLLRAISEGAVVHWAIASAMTSAMGYSTARIAAREHEIAQVAAAYGFAGVHRASFPAARLDTVPMAERVGWFAEVVNNVKPDTLYLPHPHDVHSDHAAVFDAAAACTKSFRHPSVRRVYGYETLSETEFGLRPGVPPFQPNRFVDVAAHIDRKIEIMGMFAGEMAAAPFPRSAESIRALAAYRGGVAGTVAAEAFMVLRELE